MLRTISHNVRSLRQPEAIEVIIASMQANHVEAYCMHEVWCAAAAGRRRASDARKSGSANGGWG